MPNPQRNLTKFLTAKASISPCISFDKALWRIPATRTKMRRQHDVALSRQAIAILREIWPLSDQTDLIFRFDPHPQKAAV